MLETFLILLAGGVMLAAAIPNPRDVTLNWLRLAGIVALTMVGLAALITLRTDDPRRFGMMVTTVLLGLAVLGQLGLSQVGWRNAQRMFAVGAATVAVLYAINRPPPQEVVNRFAWFQLLSWLGIAAMCGIALMDMLLGHAYLTASQMTMKPFVRLNTVLAIALIFRALCAAGLVLILQ